MSTSSPPSTTTLEARPSPWLTWAASVAVPLLALAVSWGVQGANLANLERRVTATEAEQARSAAERVATGQQLVRLDEHMGGVERELQRLSSALERLTQSRTARELP